MLDNRH